MRGGSSTGNDLSRNARHLTRSVSGSGRQRGLHPNRPRPFRARGSAFRWDRRGPWGRKGVGPVRRPWIVVWHASIQWVGSADEGADIGSTGSEMGPALRRAPRIERPPAGINALGRIGFNGRVPGRLESEAGLSRSGSLSFVPTGVTSNLASLPCTGHTGQATESSRRGRRAFYMGECPPMPNPSWDPGCKLSACGAVRPGIRHRPRRQP